MPGRRWTEVLRCVAQTPIGRLRGQKMGRGGTNFIWANMANSPILGRKRTGVRRKDLDALALDYCTAGLDSLAAKGYNKNDNLM